MLMLTLWGRTTSINVQKVMWTLAEVNCTYERIDAGGTYGLVNTPEFLARNPNGLVPVLEDAGFMLWESGAIIRYLANKFGRGNLWPASPQDAARADQWMEWATTSLYADTISVCFMGLVRTRKADRNLPAIAEASRRLGQRLKILDAHLADRRFILGDTLSAADIPAGALMYRYYRLPIERPPLPNVEAWHQRLRERATYRDTVEVDYSSLQAPD